MRRGEEGCGNFAQQEKSIQNISEIENNQNRTQKMQIIANGPPVFGKKKKTFSPVAHKTEDIFAVE